MKIKFQKYQGTGNDFIIINNSYLNFPEKNKDLITRLCDRKFGIGADGLILINPSKNTDFEMVYFNSDGLVGSMCGNGARCSAHFAMDNGISKSNTLFNACDGNHSAAINDGVVSLSMKNVTNIKSYDDGFFIDTGSPHFIKIVDDLEQYDVYSEGKNINNSLVFKKDGVNVNFVQKISNSEFIIRTYERGVNNETLSCGTGVTAVALAMYKLSKTSLNDLKIKTLGGDLSVSFSPSDIGFEKISLSGKVEFIFKGEFQL
ncbi:MAG TPA: diaminopimelate epimerase [Flavobacteriaceae bacterium]|jgi:diaminopimelate epimerase|nr:diaminopimelate epimerase [Flavobacteriaceae bacterium]